MPNGSLRGICWKTPMREKQKHKKEKVFDSQAQKTTVPFLVFGILSLLSSFCLGGIIYTHCDSYGLNNIYQNISFTISISLFGIFIPLVFAAITYCKTKLTQITPEIFSNLTVDNWIKFAVLVLGLLFFTALVTPLMEMEKRWYGLLQLCLILFAFSLSGSFIWGMFQLAKYPNMLKAFGITARNKLTGQISKYGQEQNKNVENHVRHIVENFISMINASIKRGSREDLEVTLNELQLYICDFFDLINENLTKIRKARVSQEQKFHEYWRASGNFEEFHKSISDLLFVEITKLIDGISNVQEEKYLEDFVPFLMATIPKTLSLNIGYHSGRWSDFINETTLRTVILKNTAYPHYAIDLYNELIKWEFKYQTFSAVYALCPKLSALLEILNLLKLKEQFNKMWYSTLQVRVINLMLSMLPMCTRYECDHLTTQKWAEYVREIIPKICLDDGNPLMDGNPVLTIIQIHSPDSLPFVYKKAAENIFCTDYHDEIKVRQLHTLIPVFSIYYALIGKNKGYLGEWSQCLAAQFYIDLEICKNIDKEFVVYWIESLSEEYKHIFEGVKSNYTDKGKRVDFSEVEQIFSVPAISLVVDHENQIKLADQILIRFSDMLISMFNANEQKDANGRERANILLLSAWLKKTNRLQEKREELEVILKQYPYSNFSKYMNDYQACGYPIPSFRKWYLLPAEIWPKEIQQRIETELMDLIFLKEYGKQFIIATGGNHCPRP